MDPEDILALRKTSKHFRALTHDPRLWSAVYHRMRQTHPNLNCSESEFAALESWQSERLLLRASKTAKVFQTFRDHAKHRIFPSGQAREIGPLAMLAFLSERFLLSADDTTMVYVWDMSKLASSAEAPAFPCARLALVDWKFLTYGISNDHSILYIVLAKHAKAHVFSLCLPSTTSDAGDEPKLSFRDVAYFDTHFNKVSSIDADSRLAFLQTYDDFIEVLNWQTETRAGILLLPGSVGAHSHRNYVIAQRICGPYILCFRRWSVEAYPVPLEVSPESATNTDKPLPVLQHAMPGMAFVHTRLSSVSCHRHRFPSGSGSVDVTLYTLCALVADQRRGTHHYEVRLQTTPMPLLSLRLLSVDGTQLDGRVSAWDLGTSGRLGAWVLGPDRQGARHVVTFAAPASRFPFEPVTSVDPLASFSSELSSTADADAGLDVPPEIAPRFKTRVVSIVSLRDSDDDVWRLAVSEFTGRIALGSRTGAITVI